MTFGSDHVSYKLYIKRVLSVCWLKKLKQEPGSFEQRKERNFPSAECCRFSAGHCLREPFPFFSYCVCVVVVGWGAVSSLFLLKATRDFKCLFILLLAYWFILL